MVEPVKISFGVKRKDDNKVNSATISKVVVDVEADSDEEREREEEERQAKRRKMTHFDEGSIVGDEDKQKEVAVIPMVIEHDWRTQKLLEKEKEGTLTDEEKAKLALLVGTSNEEENDTSNKNGAEKITISNGVETAEDADYSAIPIENFGLAILRGCNWKDGDGIGKNPQKVALRLPARRPPGLGLGATPKNPSATGTKNDGDNKKEEVVEIKKGTCIKIIDGRSKGLYGKVEARDDDTNSLFVRLAIGSKSIKVSLYSVQGISVKEYERDAKCLNKAEYDKEKEKIEKQREEKEVKHLKEPSTSTAEKSETYSSSKKEELWVRADLLVRFIDKEYKHGKLYNQKVRVVDVAGIRDVTIEDDRGNTFYNIKQSWLETVIPRNIGEKLMIVGRKNGGKLAIMIDKDKRKEKVTAKLLQTSETLSVYFEDVCAVSVRHEEDYE
ncbi:unnamed protein product [Caenorhabditis angaria]|uniref:G-patch domain-containing protein n=1 Tax=Caenorhabditis angaria TaxID=860376 RepID=A0A9P1IQ13_9PELO|nr:unnamed protein product [Caenorhabditis angaria]